MKLVVKYIGRVGVNVNGKSITEKLSEKAKGILLYMVLNNKEYHRNHLKQLFWCDFSESSANRNLRHAVWNIRKVFRSIDDSEEVLVNVSKSVIKLSDTLIIIKDIDFFNKIVNQEIITEEEIDNCIENFGQDLLENFYISDSQDFNNWVYYERESFRRKYFNDLLGLSKKYIKSEEYYLALKVLNNLVLLDSYNESLYLMIMKLHVRNGNKSFAMHTYNEAKKVLREELNLGLSKEMTEYYKLINQSIEKKPIKKEVQVTIDFDEIIDTGDFMTIIISDKIERVNGFKYKFISFNKVPIIELSKIPGRRLPYEGVFEFIDEYTYLYKEDISIGELNKIALKKTKHIDDLILFSQIADFLKNHDREKILVLVYDLAYMDDKFIDFISYIYRKDSCRKMQFIIAYNKNWETSRMKFFVDAMDIMKDIKIIKDYND